MEYISLNPSSFLGQAVGTGQCVALVQVACKAPLTHNPDGSPLWKAGIKVQDAPPLPGGIAIACFGTDGTYQNRTDGSSHAAILIGKTAEGLYVIDQWLHQPAHQRIIRFKAPGVGDNCDNGIYFSVIEVDGPNKLGSGATGAQAATDFISANKPSA
jgi:hypothetical protein